MQCSFLPLLVLANALLTCSLPAVTLTNSPSADTYSEAYGSENKNFGSALLLRMDQWGGRQVFLRFPLEIVPSGQSVAEAKLRLYVTEIGFAEAGEFPELKTCVAVFD